MKTVINKAFDHWPEVDQSLACKCGINFLGRAKFRYDNTGLAYHEIDRPCSKCGDATEIVRVSSPTESFTIRRDESGEAE